MIILPAIDIKGGQCVRLYQGDYAQVSTYDADPVKVAQRWQSAGASWLHVVDLDGAAVGHPINVEVIRKMRASTSLHIELGGGMRTLEHIGQMLDLGIDRIVLGTVALIDRELLGEALARWGERIAVGLDARNGQVAISGWRETSQVQATSLATELCAIGVNRFRVNRFIYTDIARDGALKGPNLDALREMKRVLLANREGDRSTRRRGASGPNHQGDRKGPHSTPLHSRPYNDTEGLRQQAISCSLIASGGVSSIDDLRSIATLGIEGAIVGKALYTGNVDLAAAIRELER
jgi:phosphoribosylformimino-5-aminoimidazole carboxamide ribotide isomerase